jgi:hypothetical protein
MFIVDSAILKVTASFLKPLKDDPKDSWLVFIVIDLFTDYNQSVENRRM